VLKEHSKIIIISTIIPYAMVKKPVYANIFEYLDANYEFKAPSTPLTRFYKKDIAENQYQHLDGPVASERYEFGSKEEAAEMVAEFAWACGADLTGFTEVTDGFVFEGIELDPAQKYAVVTAMEMDFDRIATAPEPPSGIEVLRVYWRLGTVAVKLAEFIRSLGYSARAHHPRGFVGRPPTILQTRAGIEAGLGEAGRMGLLITPEYGPRVRVATVTTELQLPQSPQKTFGVEQYCENCNLCMKACEGDAIPEKKKEERGFIKYTIDPYKCLPYFAEYDGCNLCVSECAFNRRDDDLKQFIKKINDD
jgi:ferredoxin